MTTTPENLNDRDNCTTRIPHNTVWQIRERVSPSVSDVLSESDAKHIANMAALRKKLDGGEIPTAKSENDKRTGESYVEKQIES